MKKKLGKLAVLTSAFAIIALTIMFCASKLLVNTNIIWTYLVVDALGAVCYLVFAERIPRFKNIGNVIAIPSVVITVIFCEWAGCRLANPHIHIKEVAIFHTIGVVVGMVAQYALMRNVIDKIDMRRMVP